MRRVKFLVTFFIFIWIVLLIRIYYISIKSNSYYEQIAKKNAVRLELIAPTRGLIFDTNSNPLAINQVGFAIGIAPQLSKKSKINTLDQELDFLVLELPFLDKETLKKKYLKNDSPYSHTNVQIVDFVMYDNIVGSFSKISLRENLSVYPVYVRNYPNGAIASHVIGYIGKPNEEETSLDDIAKLTKQIGKSGIEKFYDTELKGEAGSKEVKITALNVEIDQFLKKSPKSKNIHLTLDIRLQEFVTKLFENQSGSLIVMSIEDGAILAAGSFPEHDLNLFASGISHEEWKIISEDFNHPFTNRLINGLYPPGSVVKMSMALAFLNSGKITKDTKIFTEGEIELNGRKFRDWKREGHGITDLRKAIRVSNDVYFYKNSLLVGMDAITPVLERQGFGAKTGVDLPNEFIGVVPGRDWKRNKYGQAWYPGETVISSIGQGFFLSTVMQVTRNIGMIASGKNITPHFIKSIDDEVVIYETEDNIFNELEKKNLPTIRAGMFDVCNDPSGTGYRYVSTKIKIACKTGTAQVVGIPQEDKVRMKESELEYYQRSHAWFVSYGPYTKPKYVVSVLVEHGGSGGRAGGDIASKVYNKLAELGYID